MYGEDTEKARAEQLVCPDGATHGAQFQAGIDLFVYPLNLEVLSQKLTGSEKG